MITPTPFIADTTTEYVGVKVTTLHSAVLPGVHLVYFSPITKVNEIELVASSRQTSDTRKSAVA